MQAKIFYQSSTEGAIPLTIIYSEQLAQQTSQLNEAMRHQLESQFFQGKLGEVAWVYNQQGFIQAAYLGAGDQEDDKAIAHGVTRLPQGVYQPQMPLSHTAQISWASAQYRFDRYKKDEYLPRILVLRKDMFAAVLAECNAVFTVRDLINTPANDLGPDALAHIIKALAATHQATFKEWIGEELLQANFPAVYAVGRAAANAPRFIHLSWGDDNHPRVALVGKGVCFDSGGLNVKPSANMRLMKKDMGGAAQVIGLAQWLMSQRVPIKLDVYIPAVENAIGGDAYRPGDVLTMRNGLQVEIEDTDAEGRLVLADALVKACEQLPDVLIDFSTLTGAARIAVGTEISAMFSNHDTLAASIYEHGEYCGDPVWRLPLFQGYARMLESTVADLSNTGASSYAGAITAALFLQRFIVKNIPWVHFDIMAWNINNRPGRPEGGEAMGMQAVAHYLLKTYADCDHA